MDINAYSHSVTNKIEVALEAGIYDVEVIDTEYEAWSAWKDGYGNNTGWLNNYWMSYSNAASDSGTMIGSGGIFSTPATAFAAAVDTSFTLASAGSVYYHIWDSNYADNAGGISLSITQRPPVPEPATALLFGAGLIGFAAVGRRKEHWKL